MKINLRNAPLAARFVLWLALFFVVSIPALVFDAIASVSRRAADGLCDAADLAVLRGRKLRERLQ
jgi:hypothetical protein